LAGRGETIRKNSNCGISRRAEKSAFAREVKNIHNSSKKDTISSSGDRFRREGE